MSFREKSAWLMGLLMAAAGLYYYHVVRGASEALGVTAPPIVVIAVIVVVVAGAIVGQVVLAISLRNQANAPADERERLVQHRAGSWSGLVLAAGAVLSLGHFMAHGDGNMLFHLIVASLIVAQIAEYTIQILLLRRSF